MMRIGLKMTSRIRRFAGSPATGESFTTLASRARVLANMAWVHRHAIPGFLARSLSTICSTRAFAVSDQTTSMVRQRPRRPRSRTSTIACATSCPVSISSSAARNSRKSSISRKSFSNTSIPSSTVELCPRCVMTKGCKVDRARSNLAARVARNSENVHTSPVSWASANACSASCTSGCTTSRAGFG